MNFVGRLKYYLIGFGLGCVIVWATLYRNSDRPSWLPEGRILEFLEKTEIKISDELKCKLECNSIPLDFLNAKFFKNANVDFKQSATQRKPCPEYHITSTLPNKQTIVVYIENCELCEGCSKEGTAELRNFELTNAKENCNCGD
ncbi:MAG: hypothetical protein H6589_02360 [Flavobacteriales bacterium]|nr:hypothetical protein [Flavobacteriales bacterium]